MASKMFRFGEKSRSLFAKLMTSFLIIIILLAAFNVFTFLFLKNKIHDETVKYNNANLQTTVAGYETQIKLVSEMLLNYYTDGKLSVLKSPEGDVDYGQLNAIQAKINASASNPYLYLDNIIVYFKNKDLVVEKEGTSNARTMFTKYYSSTQFPYEFWRQQFDEDYDIRTLPAASFAQSVMQKTSPKGLLLPLIVKSKFIHNAYLIALLDANRLYQALHVSVNNNFYILDSEDRLLYSSSPEMERELPRSFNYDTNWTKRDDRYFFYKKGAESGLTYVFVIPYQSFASQLAKLNSALITLLVITVAISIGTSVMFAIRFNNPVKRMIQSVQQLNSDLGQPFRSRIHEFDLISDKIDHMIRSNESIHDDLAHKNSLLRTFVFTNRIKNIHMNVRDFEDLTDTGKPFAFVLYHIRYKESFAEQLGEESFRATYFFREYVDYVLSRTFQETFTIQLEKDQILSLVSIEAGGGSLADKLSELKTVFESEREFCFLTIAASSVYPDSSHFTAAYDQVQSMLRLRTLNDEIQIIKEDTRPQAEFRLTPLHERELQTKLMSGNAEAVGQWLKRLLSQLENSGASSEGVRRFVSEVVARFRRELHKMDPNRADLDHLLVRMEEETGCFYSYGQYEAWFDRLLQAVLPLLQKQPEELDPIVGFVLRYMESNLDRELSLDILSSQLNITANYLSTYFKEKTGSNVSEYLNDLRIRKAKEMLGRVDLKISAIAAHVGYHNVNSFIRMFKRYSGVTPGEFRKAHAVSDSDME